MVALKRIAVISGGRSATKTVCRHVSEVLHTKSTTAYQFPGYDVKVGETHLGEILNFQLESVVGFTDKHEPCRVLPLNIVYKREYPTNKDEL